jgi:transposase
MTPPPRLDIPMAELEALLERAKAEPLSAADYEILKAALATLGYLTELLEDRTTTLRRLRHLLFGARTEKTRTVCPLPEDATAPGGPDAAPAGGAPPPQGEAGSGAPRPGHGRNGARAYRGARQVVVPHASLHAGDRCPGCQKGKVYPQREPAYLVRVVGQAPLGATVYALERFRCNLCGEVFPADPPAGVGPAKYDASAGSMVALLKYGSGVPFHRLAQLQGSLGIPLPAATQWEIVAEVAAALQPAYAELIRQAAQGEVLHNDDTGATILALARAPTDAAAETRTGTFTSGIVATRDGREIACFFTGRQHAGENLADVLRQRAATRGPPIQMCDALARNAPAPFQVILANCLAHARRQFVEIAPAFPAECRVVLEILRQVYRHDAAAKAEGLTPAARLAVHQERSAPLMAELDQWLTAQVAERRVEPNSGLGKAIAYVRKHWEPLTRFLHVAGAPLDNNIAERALKKAILHRKNSMFFQTERGAQVADLFMSLIYTCQRNGADPFHYLTTLQTHAAALAAAPPDWLPWTYRDTMARSKAEAAPGPSAA